MRNNMKNKIFFTVLYVSLLFNGFFILFSRSDEGPKLDNQNEIYAYVRGLAYESLSKEGKIDIINWGNAEVENYKSPIEHFVFKDSKEVDIRGVATYRVYFKTNIEWTVGPLYVYVDKYTYEVYGVGIRK